ncbi:MAG TPA: tetratricopeptide repeat protein [Bryobacteraceae bacterium]|nr:tetratricopeptide repeat protein [Bryobacteraceae bacterium]
MLPESAIPKSSILEQLERILASGAFAQSERMCRFLRLVVEYSLENRGVELKEYLIGLRVFDRKSSFDPRVDPIVRVEARRLRSKLQQFYERDGSEDDIRIELPKGNYAAQFSRREAEAPEIPARPGEAAIAVIPFANLTPEEENDYFSDGLTQELILGLTRVPGLRVVAWTSAAQLRGEHDFQAIGKRLNVGAVLTGSVRKAGNRVRVTAQLIDTANSSYLWSEAYDRELRNLLQIQDEISRAIVATLRIRLADRLPFPAIRRAAWNFEAHNLYLKGRFEWNQRTPERLRGSVGLFQQSIELEPEFALGWAGLADAYTLLADYGVTSSEESMPKAKHAALRALELEPSLGEAWASLALVLGLYEWDRDEAEECYLKGISLNPGYSTVHHWYSVDHLVVLGRFDEAEAEIRRSRMLDPWSTIIIEGDAFIQMLRGRYDEAIRLYGEALAIDPKFYKSWTSTGRALIQKGQYEEGIRMLEKGRALVGDVPNILGALGQAHALNGNADKAREILQELRSPSREGIVPFTCMAIVHLGLGETDQALDALERACERRETPLNGLKVHPVYDGLRGHPRFEALLRRVRLA